MGSLANHQDGIIKATAVATGKIWLLMEMADTKKVQIAKVN